MDAPVPLWFNVLVLAHGGFDGLNYESPDPRSHITFRFCGTHALGLLVGNLDRHFLAPRSDPVDYCSEFTIRGILQKLAKKSHRFVASDSSRRWLRSAPIRVRFRLL